MKKADIILKSSCIYTCTDLDVFAGFVAVKGNRILAVGSDNIAGYIDENTEVIELGDKLILPGFIDAHDHFFDGAVTSSEHMCDITSSKSEEEAVEMLKEYASSHPDEKRIRAMGWFPANWNDAPLPTRKSLDKEFPKIPVYCIAADFHTIWLNEKALEESGYTAEYIPPSGEIGKFEDGTLNGLLFEPDAFQMAMEKIMDFTIEEEKENLKAFLAHIAKAGITAVSDMSAGDYSFGNQNNLIAAKELSETGELTARIHVYSKLIGYEDFTDTIRCAEKYNDDRLKINGVKGFIDGVTSTFTGLLLEPYTDRPDTTGIGVPVVSHDDLKKYVIAANKAGLPVRLHCIAEGAVRMALDIYEESLKVTGHKLNNTIEHIETIDEQDIPRFKELNVIPSMQPQHLTLDFNEKIRRLGEKRCRWEWPHRSLLDAGAVLAFGTDYPVVDFNPYPSLYTAVTRLDMEGNPTGINPEEKITLKEAIYAYTAGSAAAYGRLDELGTLEEGKLADIVVADRNLFIVPEAEIKDAQTAMTVMDGKIVYSSI